MPGRLGPGLLLATALGGGAFVQAAFAQGPSRFDGEYVGKLTLTALIRGDCTEPPWGALYPLSVSGGQVRFSYVPRFATTLVGLCCIACGVALNYAGWQLMRRQIERVT